MQTHNDDKLYGLMMEHRKQHRWFVSAYTSPITRNGEFSLVKGESCKASWSGFKMKHTNNRCEASGSKLCQHKIQSLILK